MLCVHFGCFYRVQEEVRYWNGWFYLNCFMCFFVFGCVLGNSEQVCDYVQHAAADVRAAAGVQ
jgi:hypothetical protein